MLAFLNLRVQELSSKVLELSFSDEEIGQDRLLRVLLAMTTLAAS